MLSLKKTKNGGIRMKRKLFCLLCLMLAVCVVFSSCEVVEDESGEYRIDSGLLENATATEDNYRVFYEIFVGSFSDSDGDGTGDIRGIINRMDYLNDGDDRSGKSLGVEGLWLTPIFESPSYHKYDVTDYYAIDDSFGTEDDFKELLSICHDRNVKVIIDLPINHTGYLNKWYSEFIIAHRNGDIGNKYYDYYSFYSAGETAPSGRSFSQVSGTTDFVETNFSGEMPELNFDNDDVRQEVIDIAKYYIDLGVDGFRFDAAKYIYLGDNAACAEFWSWYIGELKEMSPDIYTVAEVWDSDGITDLYYPALNCFNFTTSGSSGLIAETAKAGDVNKYVSYVQNYVKRIEGLNQDAMILPFITNHDMDRAGGFLPVSNGQAMMAANLYILSSGSLFIYYGEELGMKGSRGGAQTDANRRLAMIWGDGDTVMNPAGTTYDSANQTAATAAEQLTDQDSLYTYYKTLIAVRKSNPEICRGEYTALSLSDKMSGFLSTYNGSTVCVLHNTTQREMSVKISDISDIEFTLLAAAVGLSADEESTYLSDGVITVGPQTSVVLRQN